MQYFYHVQSGDTLYGIARRWGLPRKAENDRILAISNCFATPVTWSSSGRSIGYLSGCSRQEFATEMWVVNVNHPVPIRQLTRSSLMSLQWSPLPITETPLNTFTS